MGKIKYTCDECGKKLDDSISLTFMTEKEIEIWTESEYDLCEECIEKAIKHYFYLKESERKV